MNATKTKVTKTNELTFNKKESMYYVMIDKFFNTCSAEQINKMIDIINGNSEISLRVLDWVVTRYAKKKIGFNNGTDDFFDMHISYKAQLRSYKKIYFDPFRRRNKFNYHYDPKNKQNKILTTLGQLNFFKWATLNNIILFVENNLQAITKAMFVSNKEDKKKKLLKSDNSTQSNDTDKSYDSDDESCDSDKNSKNTKNIIIKKNQYMQDDDIIDSDSSVPIILHF